MVSERVRKVFERASNDAEFDRLLWTDPEAAGRSLELSGTDLFQLVGEIGQVRRGDAEREPQLQVIRDYELHRLGNTWPFGELDPSGLQERAQLGAKFAKDLLVGVALQNQRDERVLSGLESWARALEAEVRSRVQAQTEVDLDLADALVSAARLIHAVEVSRS